MKIGSQQIRHILSDPNLSEEAKKLIEGLILDKKANLQEESSSALPELFRAKVRTPELKDNQEKSLEDIVLDVQNYLRENYTKAFAAITNKDDRIVIKKQIDNYVLDNQVKIEGLSTDETIKKIQDEILDFGQLNDLIYDNPQVEEIRINGSNDPVKVMIAGKQYDTEIILSPDNVYLIAERMVRTSRNAEPLRKDKPFTRVRLGNNIRVTVITDPIARESGNNGRVIQMIIRKQANRPFGREFLLKNTINQYGYYLIHATLQYKVSEVFFGGTNSGKTGTLRSFLSSSIPNNRRGITVAEIDEMDLRKLDPVTGSALNEIMMWELSESLMTFRQAVNAAMTCSPEILILQEMKGEECVEVMDASITGHQMVVTMHSEDLDVFAERVLFMYKQSGSDIQDNIILSLIPSAFPVVNQMELLSDGKRRITSVDEIVGFDKQKNKLRYVNLLKYVIDDTIYELDEEGNELDVKEVIGYYEVGEFPSDKLIRKMKKGGMSNRTLGHLKTLYEEEKKKCLQ